MERSLTVHCDHGNIMAALLTDKRSENTRRAYQKDLEDFFLTMAGKEAGPEIVRQFLALERSQAVTITLQYKALLIQKGLAEATINRRLAALRSLVSFARTVGQCEFSLDDVKGEKIESYRDTSGVSPVSVAAMLAIPNRKTVKGKRDYAILRLLWENALRRGEVVKTNIEDFDSENFTLAILGKGKGTQKQSVTLSMKAGQALIEWLQVRGEAEPQDPLFIALDNANRGHRLTGEAVAHLVRQTAKAAGISKAMSPHRMRHSAITAALEATNGNVAAVQKLSRHAKVETVMVYEDKRTDQQKKVTDILSGIA